MTSPTPDLSSAILQTLAYSDIFDYPLTAPEIHRYLIGIPTTLETIQASLANGLRTSNQVTQTGEYFTLPGREEIANTRTRRATQSARLWPIARAYGYQLGGFPFVRMVALTGTLAVNNVDQGADFDYFIVTQPGRLWLCRAFVIGLVRVAARRGHQICPNFFLAETSLVLPDHTLYIARELTQMIPLYGLDIYHRIREANGWVCDLLPNAGGPPPIDIPTLPASLLLKSWLEPLFANPLGTALEHWEMNRKIRKFTAQAPAHAEIRFSPERCQGHFDGYGKRTMAVFEARVRRE